MPPVQRVSLSVTFLSLISLGGLKLRLLLPTHKKQNLLFTFYSSPVRLPLISCSTSAHLPCPNQLQFFPALCSQSKRDGFWTPSGESSNHLSLFLLVPPLLGYQPPPTDWFTFSSAPISYSSFPLCALKACVMVFGPRLGNHPITFLWSPHSGGVNHGIYNLMICTYLLPVHCPGSLFPQIVNSVLDLSVHLVGYASSAVSLTL